MPTTGELQKLGEVAVEFGNLEFHLDSAIWELVAASNDDLKRLLQAVTVEMSFDRKVHAFASLFKLRFPEEAKDEKLETIVAELFDAQRKRNAVLHSAWSHTAAGPRRLKGSARVKPALRWQLQTASAQELAAVSAQIAETSQNLNRFSLESIQQRLRRDDSAALQSAG